VILCSIYQNCQIKSCLLQLTLDECNEVAKKFFESHDVIMNFDPNLSPTHFIKRTGENFKFSTPQNNIVKCTYDGKDVYLQDCQKGLRLLFLQPFYNQGDLKKYLLKSNPNLKTKKNLAHQMLSACTTVNQANVIHRDIKPENFFLNKNKEGKLEVFLADFGEAVEQTDSENKRLSKGTPQYFSPEYARSKDLEQITNHKLDAWALGVTLFELFSPNKKEPFWVPGNNQRLISSLTQKQVDDECKKLPREIQPLIKELLQVDPEKRLSAQEALQKYGNTLT
jgi:serine/threonine protein kinase